MDRISKQLRGLLNAPTAEDAPCAETQLHSVEANPSSNTVVETHHDEAHNDLIAGIAVELWRLGRRVERMAATRGEESVRTLRDSMQRIDDIMQAHAVEVRLHDGERYIDGSALEVIHQRDDGESLVIVETIRPSVVIDGRILRHGQVVVGVSTAQVQADEAQREERA